MIFFKCLLKSQESCRRWMFVWFGSNQWRVYQQLDQMKKIPAQSECQEEFNCNIYQIWFWMIFFLTAVETAGTAHPDYWEQSNKRWRRTFFVSLEWRTSPPWMLYSPFWKCSLLMLLCTEDKDDITNKSFFLSFAMWHLSAMAFLPPLPPFHVPGPPSGCHNQNTCFNILWPLVENDDFTAPI